VGDVQQTFITDSKQAETALARLIRDNEKLRESVKHVGEESRKHHESFIPSIREQIMELGKMAAGYLTIEKGIDVVVEAYKRWDEKMEATSKRATAINLDLIKTLGQTGTMQQGPEIEAFLRSLAQDKVATREEGTAVFGGVAAGAAGGSDLKRQLDLTREVAGLGPLVGRDKSAMTDVGMMAGQLGTMFKDKSAGDITDVIMAMRQMAGTRAGEMKEPGFLSSVEMLSRAGFSEDEALGMGATALHQNLSTKFLTSLENSLTDKSAQKVPKGRHDPLSEDDEAKNRFLAIQDARKRFELLQEDAGIRKAVLGDNSEKFLQLLAGDPAAAAQHLRRAQATDFAASQVQGLNKTIAGLDVNNAQQEAAVRDETSAKKEVFAQAREHVKEAFETVMERDKGKLDPVSRFRLRTSFNVDRIIGDFNGNDPAAALKRADEFAGEVTPGFREAYEEQTKLYHEMLELQREQNKLLEEQRNKNAPVVAGRGREAHGE
jgi:hypothetical protein